MPKHGFHCQSNDCGSLQNHFSLNNLKKIIVEALDFGSKNAHEEC